MAISSLGSGHAEPLILPKLLGQTGRRTAYCTRIPAAHPTLAPTQRLDHGNRQHRWALTVPGCTPSRSVYGAVESSLNASGVLRGALFWEWLADGESPTETGIRVTDSTWQCAAARCTLIVATGSGKRASQVRLRGVINLHIPWRQGPTNSSGIWQSWVPH